MALKSSLSIRGVESMKALKKWGLSAALLAVASVNGVVFSAPASAQPVGERSGDVCRRVDITATTELFLYSAPSMSSNAIVAMFDNEQINLIRRNVSGTDGKIYHEIEDSAGNKGYILAMDPQDGESTLVNCSFAPYW
jgi:polysaccharide pyruvyl transferase WcaK-like protein